MDRHQPPSPKVTIMRVLDTGTAASHLEAVADSLAAETTGAVTVILGKGERLVVWSGLDKLEVLGALELAKVTVIGYQDP